MTAYIALAALPSIEDDQTTTDGYEVIALLDAHTMGEAIEAVTHWQLETSAKPLWVEIEEVEVEAA